MKAKELLALAGAFYLMSCQSSDTNPVHTETKFYPVQFSLHLKKEILPFPDVRSMPPITIPDPVGQNNSSETPEGELFNRIEYIVYKNEDPAALVHHRQFRPTDEDFGIIYDSLPAGNYKIAFLAHSSAVATLSGDLMEFGKVTDTFQTEKTISIGEGLTVDNEIELKRIVSRIEFVSEEPVPFALKRLDMEINPYFNRTNIFTGKGTAQGVSLNIPYVFTDEERGKTAPAHSFYTFIPSGNETLSAILTATGTDESVIQKREVKGITPVINKIIRYKGKLYSPKNSEETFKISIYGNGAWDEAGEDIPLE